MKELMVYGFVHQINLRDIKGDIYPIAELIRAHGLMVVSIYDNNIGALVGNKWVAVDVFDSPMGATFGFRQEIPEALRVELSLRYQ